ncbi:MAG: hypothetical protein KJ773_02635 [Candidatus Thermoplasmatota archaeon]|nr:hypothetical protein [Candidatus Thermoplasmatota archaeon]MBU4071053.1 hypothetical protein [Candidatus Thermoplasmatota archaeon]
MIHVCSICDKVRLPLFDDGDDGYEDGDDGHHGSQDQDMVPDDDAYYNA